MDFKKTEKRRLYIDMDGVIVNHMEPWLDGWNQISERKIKAEDIDVWDFWEKLLPKEEWSRFLSVIKKPGFFFNLKPFPGAVESILELKELYDVHIISTPVCASAASDKVDWCEDFLGIHVRNVHLTYEKWHYAEPGIHIIEDSAHNADRWNQEGGDALIIDTLYNQQASGRRYYGWKDMEAAWTAITRDLKG